MIIDGKSIADEILGEVSREVAALPGRKPALAVILVGNNPASELYVSRKLKACTTAGITSIRKAMPSTASELEILEEIASLNHDKGVDGILVQLPLPSHVNPNAVMQAIDPLKDVDGFHPVNAGKLLMGERDGFIPCTPLGIRTLLERSGIEITGKHVAILGRSNIVGKPLAALLMQRSPEGNATVTVAHSHTSNMKELCLMADIIIVAIGKPNFLKADMVKNGAVVIDVGINRLEDGSKKIVGDVDFDRVKEKCSHITPVPGGVGPMTIAMLLKNTLVAYHSQKKSS